MGRTEPGIENNFLLKPYPHQHNRWVILVLIPLFVSLFMVTFQPFGLQMFSHENKNLLLIGYGLVTFVLLGFNMYLLRILLPGLFNESRWLVLSEALYQMWIVLSIAAGNYIYSSLFSIVQWNGLYGFLVFIGFTFAVAIVPILGVIIISHNYLLRKNLAGAGEIATLISERKDSTGKEDNITLSSENKNHSIETTAFQLVCIESEGNYVNTWCIEDGKIIHHVLRNTIKNIENDLQDAEGLFRCHRAYILNLRYVEQVEGNSQGYQIQQKYINKQIPVSRNYTKAFNQAIRDWK